MKYSKKVLDHFTRPHNQGKIKNADGVVTVGNPGCGDMMRLYIKAGKNKKGEEILKDIEFETLGCGAAIATSSIITDMAIGKTIDEAERITNKEVSDSLGGLPPQKQHCSNLAAEALHKAIQNYKKKKLKKQKK